MTKHKHPHDEEPLEPVDDRADAEGGPKDADARADGDEDVTLRIELAEREEKIAALQRALADMDNRRKRLERQLAETRKYALQDFAVALLPVIDNFERALESAEASRDFDALHDGLKLVHDQLISTMENFDVCRIEAHGESFDPNHHEAVGQMQSAEHDDQTVIDVHQQGYKLHDRTIRPSRVIISRTPPEPADDGPPAGEQTRADDTDEAAEPENDRDES